ncbi:MAG: TetR/AcrR family transcriptional regulator [Promethearchaeota archaeon]
MNAEQKKQTRSRSPKKKAQQFERILEAGKQLFIEKGAEGFSLRGLAKMLGMNQNNLYNYVDSKRELWIAIRNKFFKQYRDENIEIIDSHKGSNVDLLMKIFNHFFMFAENDPAASLMMHIIPSPPSDKVGKFEKEYKPYNFLIGTTKKIQQAINNGEIKEDNGPILSFFMYSVILGATLVEANMRLMENERNPAEETVQFATQPFTSQEFRKYVLKKIELGLTDPNLIVKESDYRD